MKGVLYGLGVGVAFVCGPRTALTGASARGPLRGQWKGADWRGRPIVVRATLHNPRSRSIILDGNLCPLFMKFVSVLAHVPRRSENVPDILLRALVWQAGQLRAGISPVCYPGLLSNAAPCTRSNTAGGTSSCSTCPAHM